MSLDWNTKQCQGDGVTSGWIDFEKKEGSSIHPDTNSLVWGAFCGFHIGSITVKNIDEVIWRIEFLKHIGRSWISSGSFPSIEAIQEHVGLYTNCVTKTRKQWLAFVTRSLGDEVSRIIDNMYATEDRVHAVSTL